MDPFDEIYLTEEAAERLGVPIARAFEHEVRQVGQWFYQTGATIAGAADAWYHRHHLGGPPTAQPGPRPFRPRPIDDDNNHPRFAIDDYAGFARPLYGLVGHDTFLGRGRSPSLPVLLHPTTMARSMDWSPGSPPQRITRSMARAAKRAAELMESPRVRRTAEGVWRHTRINVDRGRVSVRFHPYRAAAHAFGFGHLAHAIP